MLKTALLILILVFDIFATTQDLDFRLYFCFIMFAKNKDRIMNNLVPLVNVTMGLSDPNGEVISRLSRKYSMSVFKDCRRIMNQYNDEEVYNRVRNAISQDSNLIADDFINLNRNFTQIISEHINASDDVIYSQIGFIQSLKQVIS